MAGGLYIIPQGTMNVALQMELFQILNKVAAH